MDVTRRVMTNVPPGVKAGMGPAGAFQHMRTYPAADFREVVRPNFDTLYSIAWLDMTKEPMVVSVPDSGGRYYVLPLYDMWTDVYAVPGKRTSGTGAANYAVVPPGWTGSLPAGVERIDSPTTINWVIGRSQTNGPSDYAAVNRFQDGFRITPLSQWGKPSVAPPAFVSDPAVDMKTPPLNQVNDMTGDKYFSYAAELMKLHKPHATDWSVVARMKRLGIVPGRSFDFAGADPVVRQALVEAPAEGLKQLQAAAPNLARVVNGWQMLTETMGVYGNSYLKRAWVTMVGLGALLVLILAVAQLPPLLVLGPAILYLVASDAGTVTIALFTAWSVIVTASDAVLKPLLLGRGTGTPMPVILIRATGGLLLHGLIGLFVGAVVFSTGYRLFGRWMGQGADAQPGPAAEAAPSPGSPSG